MQTRRNRPRGRCRKDRNRDTHKGADAKRLAGRRKKTEDACLFAPVLIYCNIQSPSWIAVSVQRRLQSLSLYRKFLLHHELCKQIALQKQGTENRRLRLEDIKTFFSKIVIVDIIKFM